MTTDREVKFEHVNKPRSYKYAIGAVALFLLAVISMSQCEAQAASATVTWTNPTANVNGTPIPAAPAPGSLTSTRVEWGSCASANVFGTKAGEVVVNQPATTATITSLADATLYCFRAFAKNTYGTESDASNVASKTTPSPKPNPPVLSSTITTAYELSINSTGVRLGRAVGTMPVGTPCLDNPILTNRGEYYEIDRQNVTLIKEPRSLVIVTKCAWGG